MVVNALTKTGKWILYLLAALLVLIALLVASVRLAVFYSDDHSEQLAAVVSSYVGSPVEIGGVDLVWNRFDAIASLKDIKIRSADDTKTMLALPQIELELNVRDMLLQRNLSVRSVQLSKLSLAASYEGLGKFRMLGAGLSRDDESALQETDDLKLPGTTGKDTTQFEAIDSEAIPDGSSVVVSELPLQESDSASLSTRGHSVLNWFFNAERIVILDSDITLVDEQRDQEYTLDNINIRAFNAGDLHQIRVSSALPGEIGEKSLASFDFMGNADDINAWNGRFYVNTDGLNLARLSDVLQQSVPQISGLADLQMWGDWTGTQVNKVRLIGAGRDLTVRQPSASGAYMAKLDASAIEFDLDWQRVESGWKLVFSQLQAQLANRDLQLDGLDLQFTQETDSRLLSLAGPDIDLQYLQPVYAYIDALLPPTLPFKTQSIRSGILRDWYVEGTLAAGSAAAESIAEGSANRSKSTLTELRVTAEDLVIDPFDKTPGISDLTTAVVFQDGAGIMVIDKQDVALSLPQLYENPLPRINVDGDIRFVADADTTAANDAITGTETPAVNWKAVSEDLRISSLDVDTSTIFSIAGLSDGTLPIDAHTTILNANLARIKDYYPMRVIEPKLQNWLETAIVGGDVVRGRLELQGDLKDFSPANQRGHFYVDTDIVGATLKFKPDWPAAENMEGNLSFSSTAMRGRVYQGTLRQAKFSDARIYIPNLKEPVVELQANAIGPLADMLDFAQTGPLAKFVAKPLGNSTGRGTSRLVVDVAIPLKKELRDKLSVDGEIVLDNAQISAKTFGIDLESVTGSVGFNRRGVIVDDLLVRYQGLPLAVNANQETKPGSSINRIRVNGPLAIASVMQSYDIPLVDRFEGVSDWNIELDITKAANSRDSRVELTATSDLSGTELKLPVPLNKKADELHEARLYRDFGEATKDWFFELPGLLKTRVRAGDDGKLQSIALALGNSDNTVLPWRGIALHGDAHRLDAFGWVKLAMGFQSDRKSGGESFPLFAKINARQMAVGNSVFDELVYIAYRDGTHQVHRFENSLVSGEVILRQNPDSEEPLTLRLDRLDKRLLLAIAAAESEKARGAEVTNQLIEPHEVPALDISVSELIWDNWRFARVGLRTEPTDRGMQITALTARQNALRVSGTGYWEQRSNAGVPAHTTSLDLTASFDNFGQAIAEIADVRSFAGGSGEAALSLTWPKPAYAPDLSAIKGRLLFNLRDGRILSVQPGAARILGLFALQSLPRRLNLDFRDITDTGLEYTGVSGNLSIADGQAQTNAVAMSGPVAEILIKGSTGIVDRTYDQKIDVLPRVSGALPLLGVLSGGPAAAVTALLADGVLRGIGVNLDEIGRRRLTLTGSWDNPVWTTVQLGSNSRRGR